MKSFAVKRDEKDPRWAKFIEWGNENDPINGRQKISGKYYVFYGFNKKGFCGDDEGCKFDHILTLDEWEAEFMQPKLAGMEYDERLLREYEQSAHLTVTSFLMRRYAKQDRITEIKAEIEKLSNELKELEG